MFKLLDEGIVLLGLNVELSLQALLNLITLRPFLTHMTEHSLPLCLLLLLQVEGQRSALPNCIKKLTSALGSSPVDIKYNILTFMHLAGALSNAIQCQFFYYYVCSKGVC